MLCECNERHNVQQTVLKRRGLVISWLWLTACSAWEWVLYTDTLEWSKITSSHNTSVSETGDKMTSWNDIVVIHVCVCAVDTWHDIRSAVQRRVFDRRRKLPQAVIRQSSSQAVRSHDARHSRLCRVHRWLIQTLLTSRTSATHTCVDDLNA